MTMAEMSVARLGVVGWPVAHSRSPLIHSHWLAEHKLPGQYELLPVAPENLHQIVDRIRSGEFIGCNLTVPHKVALLSHLTDADELDASARAIGAVNTLVSRGGGRLRALNTDALGYLLNLQQTAPAWRPEAGAAVVLGAGGAARAVVFALARHGVAELRIVNRNIDNARRLVEQMTLEFPRSSFSAVSWGDRDSVLADAQLLVNTTDLGMVGREPLSIDLSTLPATAVVSDIVYAPLVTELLRHAAARGLRTSDGLGMLLHQAGAAFEAWFGVRPVVSSDLRHAVEATFH